MKVEHLRYLLAVVDAGDLVQAGSRVGRTPAALSMTLRQLEEELGGSLFEGDRKARLSPLGEHVHRLARRAVADFEASVIDMRAFAAGSAGTVRVAAVPTAAMQLLPAMTQRMRLSHPRVRIDLRDTDSLSVVEAVKSGDVDFGIATLPQGVRDVESVALLNDSFVLVCPKEHALCALQRPVRWEDLESEDFIANGLCSRFPAPRVQQLIQDSRLMVHNTTSLLTYVRNGLGITVLPKLAIPAGTGLRCLPLADGSARRSIELLKKRGSSLSPVAQLLYGYALECTAQVAEL